MNESTVTLRSYVIGFVLSIALTLSAYWLTVVSNCPSSYALVIVILLAFIQLIVQLLFFLHLGSESKPQWNLYIFFVTIIGIGILVVGSIWIMNHLNYNMTPDEMNSYIQHMEGMNE